MLNDKWRHIAITLPKLTPSHQKWKKEYETNKSQLNFNISGVQNMNMFIVIVKCCDTWNYMYKVKKHIYTIPVRNFKIHVTFHRPIHTLQKWIKLFPWYGQLKRQDIQTRTPPPPSVCYQILVVKSCIEISLNWISSFTV